MKVCFAILSLFICFVCVAADAPKSVISKQDRKAADKEYKNALDLQRAGKPEDALVAVTRALKLVPGNLEFITTGEMLRQQILGGHLEQGNRLAAAGDTSGATERFRAALAIDPQNAYVAQRLHDVAPPDAGPAHNNGRNWWPPVD